MPIAEVRGTVAISPEMLGRVCALHDEGWSLRAYQLATGIGPLREWQGTAARLLAGRLAPHLGGPRLGMALHLKAWRDDPKDAEATYYAARTLLGRRGPLIAWRLLRRVGPLDDAPDIIRSDWLAMHASTLGRLRDFDAAESWLARAERVAPGRAWLLIERSDLYELEDRYDAALATARESLLVKAWYRPGVQATAHLLQLLDRDREAAALLEEAADRMESSMIVAQLGALQAEMGRHVDARKSWDRFAETSPLVDRQARSWLAGSRSDAAYRCGEIDAARALAREAANPFYLMLADRLDKPGDNTRRVVLDVRFVRQHYQTCAPATLAAITKFWGKDADHLGIVESICYNGTPDHRERSWAEETGWVPREFTVTWDAAVALLDRDIPFTLTTVETQSAHLQAVVGYDARRGTLLIRDPSQPYSGEALADLLLARYRSVGPRGMALVPHDRAELLDDLELPEAQLYDHLHRLQVGLRDYDRERAALAYRALQAEAPGHRLELLARQLLASYDADSAGMLAATLEALELFPDDANLRINQLGCLRVLGRRDARLALYEELCASRTADPLFRREFAHELLPDARERPKVVRLIGRALRARPLDAPALSLLAVTAWEDHRRAEALELYRFATCLQDKDEGLARTYFSAARHLHREDEALEFLEGRFDRFGTRSAQPGRTLTWALSQLDRMEEAFSVLDRALLARPLDGDLLLFAAETHATNGQVDRATERLNAATGLCRHGDWLRTAAFVASVEGDLARSKNLWCQVLDSEPSALDANRNVARLIHETEGRAAALDHLARTCERFPHNYSLHQTWIEWLRGDGPASAEPVVRRLLEIHPADAWARRELALILSRQDRDDEAIAEAQLAALLDPASSTEASVRGQVLEFARRLSEAREAYREAIRRSIDDDFAIARLIELCESRTDRVSALKFIAGELTRQVIFGNGLLAFAQHARGDLEPDELLSTLREAQIARPDLWHAWSALIQELATRDLLDDALELARRAVARFPLLPKLWLDLAAVYRARNDQAGEDEALARALQINPGWGEAARARASAYESKGKYANSRAVLERAIAYSPLDAFNHGYLADALWHLGEKELAFERLLHALRLEPTYDWAWDSLGRWAVDLKRPDAPVQFVRELTQSRSGDARPWRKLADWARVADRASDYLEAAEAMVRLASNDAIALGYRGEARLRSGDRDGATDDFRRSLELAPNTFAACSLFDLELADRDLDAARQTLDALKTHDRGEYVIAREVQLAVADRDKAKASEALARLCTSAGRDSEWPLQAADRAFGEGGWTWRAESIYASALDRDDVNPQVAALWIERWAARPHWRHPRLLGKLLARGEIGRRAAVAYFSHMARIKASRSILSCIRRHREALRADTQCWGIVGYALVAVNKYRRATWWLFDWPDRADARPWMLINLVYALRALRRHSEANRVSRRALELEGEGDSTSSYHSLWLALDNVIDGDGNEASTLLAELEPTQLDLTNQYLFRLAGLLARRMRSTPEEWLTVGRSTSRELVEIGRSFTLPADDYPAVLETYRRAVRMMASDYGTVPGLIWRFLRLFDAPRKGR